MDYNEFSRKGLIKIAEDFDRKNNNELSDFCESHMEVLGIDARWYKITPLELAIEKVIEARNITNEGIKNSAKSAIFKISNIIDSDLCH